MSWSVFGKLAAPTDVHMFREEAIKQNPECGEQFDAAAGVVIDLIHSGTVGESPHKVTMPGHSNPDHKPRDGWSNDCITITLQKL